MDKIDKMGDLMKKHHNLKANISKICGYLSDYEIDKAIESDDFNFIGNTLIDYFETKDIGYLLTKFKDSGLEEKIDDVDFSVEEWGKVQQEIKEENRRISEEWERIRKLDKDEYIQEMVKKRKTE